MKLFFSFINKESNDFIVDDLNDGTQKKFDHVVLAQSWPQTACWGMNDKWNETDFECSSCPFLPKNKYNFVMHGVWPSNFKGNHPAFCKPQFQYDPNLLNRLSLRKKLNEEWPSMEFSNNIIKNDKFWKHEWDKHGNCAMGLPGINNFTSYFTKSLELLSEHNMGKILAQSGIVPGKMKYYYEDIINAIKDALNVETSFNCANNYLTNEQYIDEVYICLDKHLKPMDCIGGRTNCAVKKPIVYPRILTTCH